MDEGKLKQPNHATEEDKKHDWENLRENKVIKALREGESLQEVMNKEEKLAEAFEKALDTVTCSDGRVPAVLDGTKLGIAGQGILLNDEQYQKLVIALKTAGVKTVTSHYDCGAAKIAFSRLEAENRLPEGITTPDELGIWFSKKLATDIGADHHHIELEEMDNVYHNEVALCLDSTGKFNPAALTDFPPCFVSSGAGFGLSEAYITAELEELSKIVLKGNHGFGHRFDKDNPFYIFVSAKDEAELEKWMNVAKKASTSLEFKDRIVVEGFVVPEEIQKEHFKTEK